MATYWALRTLPLKHKNTSARVKSISNLKPAIDLGHLSRNSFVLVHIYPMNAYMLLQNSAIDHRHRYHRQHVQIPRFPVHLLRTSKLFSLFSFNIVVLISFQSLFSRYRFFSSLLFSSFFLLKKLNICNQDLCPL